MKKFLALILLLPFFVFAQKTPNGVLMDTEVLGVVDGDTVVISATFLPKPLKPQLAVRIFGVDTPEKGFRAKCDLEATLGESATAFTKKQISKAKNTQLFLIGWDKFGGRVLGDIILDGKSLRRMLINEGYAREYYGEKKQSWC